MTVDMNEKVRAVVAEFFRAVDVSVPELADEEDLLAAGYLDSTSFFDLIAALEEKFGVQVDFLEADPAQLVSIAGLARHLFEAGRGGDKRPGHPS